MNSQRHILDKVASFGILLGVALCFFTPLVYGQTSPPAATQPTTPPPATSAQAPQTAPPSAQPAAPPSAPPQRSAAELEQLVGPIALYPDPLIAVMLPASCYPLEIVQAARFVADTNNIPKIDSQNWDENVKAVAKVPAALTKMNDDLNWTSDLGQAFLDQQKDVMDAIQAMRNKATTAGTLQTSPQQNVTVTNNIVQQTNGTQVVYVTNQIVQIEPSNPEVIYVPQYTPSAVYYPPPAYAPNPVAPLITFGVGMAVGAAINNDCDWHHGGVYVGGPGWHGGHYDGGDVNVNRNVNVNQNINQNVNVNRNAAANTANRTEWKPDSTRLRSSGAPGAAANYQSAEARGWGGAGTQPAYNAAARQPATTRQNATPPANRPNPPQQRAATPPAQASRPAQQPSRPAQQAQASRPTPQVAQASRPAPQQASRPAPSSGQSAFSGVNNGAGAQYASQRGAASRGGGAYGGGGGGGGRSGGGARGGGGRGR